MDRVKMIDVFLGKQIILFSMVLSPNDFSIIVLKVSFQDGKIARKELKCKQVGTIRETLSV